MNQTYVEPALRPGGEPNKIDLSPIDLILNGAIVQAREASVGRVCAQHDALASHRLARDMGQSSALGVGDTCGPATMTATTLAHS